MDFTIIELNEVSHEFFLLPNINDDEYYINKIIYIPQLVDGQLGPNVGKIRKIKEHKLIHDCTLRRGLSGSPIFLKNTTEIIGIYKEEEVDYKYCTGILINSIIQILNTKKEIYKSGNYYIGPFKNGLRHGKGKEYYKDGRIKYEGDFANDKFEGKGKYIYDNGNYYIGEFKNGLSHGRGILYFSNGRIKYEGDFVKDKYEGKNIFLRMVIII